MYTSSMTYLSETPEANMRQNSGLPKERYNNNNNLILYRFGVIPSRNNVWI